MENQKLPPLPPWAKRIGEAVLTATLVAFAQWGVGWGMEAVKAAHKKRRTARSEAQNGAKADGGDKTPAPPEKGAETTKE